MSTPIYTTEEDRQSMQFGIRTKLALHQHENISDANESGMTYFRDDTIHAVIPKIWIRQPHLDLEAEVPE